MSFFQGLGKSLEGGAGGLITGGIGSLIGGLFGGSQPKIPSELKNLYRMQLGMAQQQQQYARGIPLSDPQEQAALASQRGLLGDQERQQMGQLQSQYGLVNQGTNGVGDFLTNLYNQNQGQQSALTAGALQNSLLARRQALGQASGLASAAAGTIQGQYQQQTPLGPGFGELARLIAYNQTMHAASQQKPNGTTSDASAGPTASPSGPGINEGWTPGQTQSNGGPNPGANLSMPAMNDIGQWKNPFGNSLLANPALAQVTPAQNTLNTALNR